MILTYEARRCCAHTAKGPPVISTTTAFRIREFPFDLSPTANDLPKPLNIPDVLIRVMEWLPLEKRTVITVSMVCRTWRWYSNYLPHWSYLLPMKNQVSLLIKTLRWGDPPQSETTATRYETVPGNRPCCTYCGTPFRKVLLKPINDDDDDDDEELSPVLSFVDQGVGTAFDDDDIHSVNTVDEFSPFQPMYFDDDDDGDRHDPAPAIVDVENQPIIRYDAGSTVPPSYRYRIEAIYQKYAPDRMDVMERAMIKCQGRYEKLINKLVEKYGKEPIEVEYIDDDEAPGANVSVRSLELVDVAKINLQNAAGDQTPDILSASQRSDPVSFFSGNTAEDLLSGRSLPLFVGGEIQNNMPFTPPAALLPLPDTVPPPAVEMTDKEKDQRWGGKIKVLVPKQTSASNKNQPICVRGVHHGRTDAKAPAEWRRKNLFRTRDDFTSLVRSEIQSEHHRVEGNRISLMLSTLKVIGMLLLLLLMKAIWRFYAPDWIILWNATDTVSVFASLGIYVPLACCTSLGACYILRRFIAARPSVRWRYKVAAFFVLYITSVMLVPITLSGTRVASANNLRVSRGTVAYCDLVDPETMSPKRSVTSAFTRDPGRIPAFITFPERTFFSYFKPENITAYPIHRLEMNLTGGEIAFSSRYDFLTGEKIGLSNRFHLYWLTTDCPGMNSTAFHTVRIASDIVPFWHSRVYGLGWPQRSRDGYIHVLRQEYLTFRTALPVMHFSGRDVNDENPKWWDSDAFQKHGIISFWADNRTFATLNDIPTFIDPVAATEASPGGIQLVRKFNEEVMWWCWGCETFVLLMGCIFCLCHQPLFQTMVILFSGVAAFFGCVIGWALSFSCIMRQVDNHTVVLYCLLDSFPGLIAVCVVTLLGMMALVFVGGYYFHEKCRCGRRPL